MLPSVRYVYRAAFSLVCANAAALEASDEALSTASGLVRNGVDNRLMLGGSVAENMTAER